MPFIKGQSGNKNGRPKGRKNKSSPQEKLRKALENGWDMKELKKFAKELITDEKSNLNAAQVTQLIKTLFDVELKLMELDFKHSEDNEANASNSKDQADKDEDDDNGVVFKLTAD